jgi:hypothetical protein
MQAQLTKLGGKTKTSKTPQLPNQRARCIHISDNKVPVFPVWTRSYLQRNSHSNPFREILAGLLYVCGIHHKIDFYSAVDKEQSDLKAALVHHLSKYEVRLLASVPVFPISVSVSICKGSMFG